MKREVELVGGPYDGQIISIPMDYFIIRLRAAVAVATRQPDCSSQCIGKPAARIL